MVKDLLPVPKVKSTKANCWKICEMALEFRFTKTLIFMWVISKIINAQAKEKWYGLQKSNRVSYLTINFIMAFIKNLLGNKTKSTKEATQVIPQRTVFEEIKDRSPEEIF